MNSPSENQTKSGADRKSEAPISKSTMKFNRWIVTAAILTVYGTGGQLFAQEPADSIKELKRENEALQQKVKNLEEQLNKRLKNLEEHLEQKGPLTNSAGQVSAQEADWKSKEVASRFKIPD